ncbi:LysM peptidoglycan-binding domain-containing protein [Pseudoduganella sp. HUAS MS19]
MTKEYLSAKYDADTLTVDYVAGDGSHLLRSGGTVAWRFNNPGNLRPGKKGVLIYGAIGIGDTKTNKSFLIFSSYEEGRKQKKALLRSRYNDRTIYTMLTGIDDGKGKLIYGYAPKTDSNDPEKYAAVISKHTGLPTTTKLSSMTDAQLESMMDAMEKHEGFHGKKETRKEKLVPATNIVITDGAKPKADLPVKVEIAGKTHETKTDKSGRVPTIVHLTPGEQVKVFLTALDGQWKKAHEFIMEQESKTLALIHSLDIFSATTEVKKKAETKVPAAPAARTPTLYVVQPGDTAGRIAKDFETTVAEIQRDNPHIKNIARIFPGDKLSIHGKAAAKQAKAGGATKPTPLAQAPKKAAPPAKKQQQPQQPAAKPAEPARSKEGSGSPLALIPVDQKRAPWMAVAIAEAKKWAGKTESTITKTSNYHKLTGGGFLTSLEGKDNAWCASFVSYCLINAQPAYSKWKNSFRARAVALDATFVEIKEPVYGAIMLQGTHHVSFVYAKDGDSYACLGGNQSDQINFTPFKKSLRFFVPLAYSEFAKKEIKDGKSLANHTCAELNKAFGISLHKKEGDATR